MVQRQQRRLTEEELALLAAFTQQQLLAHWQHRLDSPPSPPFGCGLLFWGIAPLVLFVLVALYAGWSWGLLAAALLGALGLFLFWPGRWSPMEPSRDLGREESAAARQADQLVADARGQLHEVLEVEAAAVLALEDVGEEGWSFYFDVAPGQLLHLTGPGLYISERFPASRFLLARRNEQMLIIPTGPTLAPLRTIPAKEKARLYLHAYAPEDGELFPGTLATLQDDLRRYAQTRAR